VLNNSLAIVIPVYNNTKLLKDCLNSLQAQIDRHFDVFIFDDASHEDYVTVVNAFKDLEIKYIRNEQNLGALTNMQFAYNYLKTLYPYVMIMHEDDLLHPKFIETVNHAITVFDYPACIMSKFYSFDTNIDLENIKNTSYKNPNVERVNRNQLALLFLQLKPLAYGSVVYNTKIYANMQLDFEHYEEFADRPSLLNTLTEMSNIAIINEPLYFYRSHGITDSRWKKLKPIHVFNLLKLYRNILVHSNYVSGRLFKKFATEFVFESHKNLSLTEKSYPLFSYLFMANRNGFLSLKYALLKIPVLNKIGTSLKKIFR
jgi:glycosyltransferase involved in cell wall biosynthesis